MLLLSSIKNSSKSSPNTFWGKAINYFGNYAIAYYTLGFSSLVLFLFYILGLYYVIARLNTTWDFFRQGINLSVLWSSFVLGLGDISVLLKLKLTCMCDLIIGVWLKEFNGLLIFTSDIVGDRFDNGD